MFQVWDVKGIRSPYVPGTVRAKRLVAELQGVPPIPDEFHSDLDFTQTQSVEAVTSKPPQPVHDAYERIQRGVAPRHQLVTAQQIMNSPVVTLPSGASFDQASALIRKSRFRHVPIVDSHHKVIGIISDRDLLRYALGLAADARKHLDTLKVNHIMISGVVSAAPETEIREIARVMFEDRIGSMPIIDDKSALVGILTRSDILRALLAKAPLELWS